MKCPLCQQPLLVEESDIYKGKPTYRCPEPYPSYFRETHYLKYYEADWTYSQYREEAVVLPYRILNIYNDRAGKYDVGSIQQEKFVTPKFGPGTMKFRNLILFEKCLTIPNQEIFIPKIKTLLLFS